MENQGYILGLDASTTEVGYCIWDKEKGEIVELSHLTLGDIPNRLDRVVEFKKWLTSKLKQHPQINEMVIEEAFKRMVRGSKADILLMLSAINFAYQFVCHEFNLKVETILVQQARFNAFPDFKPTNKTKSGGVDQKTQMFDHVSKVLSKEYFPTKILKSGPRKGQEVPEDFCKDISDAYVVTLGFLRFRIKEQIKQNKKSKNVDSENKRKRRS